VDVKAGARRRGQGSEVSDLSTWRDQFVRVAGRPTRVDFERNSDPARNDHLWITIQAGRFGSLRIALSTLSLKNQAAGFDPRMRVAVVPGAWMQLPEAGVFPSGPFDYAAIAPPDTDVFREYEPEALEELVLQKTNRAIFVEGWGDLYLRSHLGIHQVHSRRASRVVPADHVGRDGAVSFYFPEHNASELLLLKFYAQS
jgi:hypothetical protein